MSTSILFVEDDALVRNAFTLLLRGEGYEVVPVSAAEVALAAAASREFDLVLMDVGLPGVDGIECALELRRQKLQMPIVFLTAFGGTEFVDRALRCAPHAYLVKPVSGEQLIPMVRSALASAEEDQRQRERMQGALNDSRVISAAVGVFMERNGCSEDEAFGALRMLARSESRPIVELAREVVSRQR